MATRCLDCEIADDAIVHIWRCLRVVSSPNSAVALDATTLRFPDGTRKHLWLRWTAVASGYSMFERRGSNATRSFQAPSDPLLSHSSGLTAPSGSAYHTHIPHDCCHSLFRRDLHVLPGGAWAIPHCSASLSHSPSSRPFLVDFWWLTSVRPLFHVICPMRGHDVFRSHHGLRDNRASRGRPNTLAMKK